MSTVAPVRRVVIVGASAAGLTAAEALRRGGFEGAVTLVGEEHHLPYDRPPLSKQILTGAWPLERTALRRASDLDALGLDLRLGSRAVRLAPAPRTVTLADGAELGYDALVVATGVRPRRLPGHTASGVHVLRTLDDARRMRDRLGAGRRLVVIGAGFLGSEVAAAARSLGASVTVVESAPVPLARVVGERVGAHFAQLHRDHGVDLRTGARIGGIAVDGGHVSGVTLADGSLLPADDVLLAIGSEPNTGWLHGSGLDLTDGVVCDQHLAAGPGVYAAGDVARWHHPLFGATLRIEHRANAAEQGIAAARALLDPERARPFAPVPYFWSDQHGVRIQAFGRLQGHDEARVVEGDLAEGRFLVAYRRARRLTGVLAVAMPPKSLHPWRAAVAARAEWRTLPTAPLPA